MTQEILTAALKFATSGVCVVPVANDGSKRPALATWKQYQSQMPTVTELMEWFGKTDVEGLGIITGAISGNLEMLELEGRAVADGMLETAKELAHNSGLGEVFDAMNNGYCEVTPSGGVHWLYRIADEDVPGNTKIARRPGVNGGVEVLCETRGEAGFVVVSPSHGGTHYSGEPWKLISGGPETIAVLSMEERDAIFNIFRIFDSMPQPATIKESTTHKDETQLSPGDDFNNRTTWADLLKPRGWSVVYQSGETTYWRRPGKSIGISATTGRNSGDNLFVFTTSTEFESEKPYSKFAAKAHLEFGGDFRACARELVAQGYGEQRPHNVTLLGTLSLLPSATNLTDTIPATTSNDEVEPTEVESSWKPQDLTKYFDGSFVQAKTTILQRTDEQALIYPSKVHSFYGESESGKSWLAQIATAEQLKQFRKVTYIDFESDAADLVFRLQALGVTQAEILQNFTYVRPEAARDHTDPYWQALLEPQANALVIIDGVTEALTMWGGETKDNDAITRWMRLFPRAIAAASGAAVVQIDHVTKNTETRGRFAIGGQAKLATIDGAAYLVEPLEALAPGRTGTLTIRVTKDRPGFVRKIGGMYRKSDRTQEVAVVHIDSTKPALNVIVACPMSEEDAIERKVRDFDKEIVEFINANPGCAKRHVSGGIKGNTGKIFDRVEQLVAMGHLENKGNDRSFVLYATDEGRRNHGLSGSNVYKLGVL